MKPSHHDRFAVLSKHLAQHMPVPTQVLLPQRTAAVVVVDLASHQMAFGTHLVVKLHADGMERLVLTSMKHRLPIRTGTMSRPRAC